VTAFTVKLYLFEGTEHDIDYNSLEDCLVDTGLQTLFDGGLVKKCSVFIGTKRITALPPTNNTWARLCEQLTLNRITFTRSADTRRRDG